MMTSAIWLNNGDASFSHYDAQDLTVPDIVVDNVFPYKDGDNLHFVGTYTPDWDRPVVRTIDIKVELDN